MVRAASLFTASVLVCAAVVGPGDAAAQTRSPRIVVDAHRRAHPPYAAGALAAEAGASAMIDVSDGLLADLGHIAEASGVQIVVDNRAGAGGIIGTELAANASRDGYTLLVVSLAHVINPWLYDLAGRYHPTRSFAPVAIIAASPVVLVAHPGLPVKSVADLLAFARRHPGKLQFASAGVGSVTHLAAELFSHTAKVQMLHVPYKGAGPAMADVIAGHVNLVFGGLLATVPHVRSGRVRALGVGSLQRNPILPEVPSIAEAGVPGSEFNVWIGMMVPGRTPREVVNRLHAEVLKALALPEVKERFQQLGADPWTMTPEQFDAYIRAEIASNGPLVKAAGLAP